MTMNILNQAKPMTSVLQVNPDWENMAHSYANRSKDRDIEIANQKDAEREPQQSNPVLENSGEEIKIEQLKNEVNDAPYNYYKWENLVKAVKLKMPNSRDLLELYREFLQEFPLLYGYWKRYALLAFDLVGKEEANQIFKKSLTYLSHCPELWLAYLQFLVTKYKLQNHEDLRPFIDDAIESSGLHWLSWKLWKWAIEYEEDYLRKLSHNIAENEDAITRSTIRLRNLFSRCLQTPLKDQNEIWAKFQNISGQKKQEDIPILTSILDLLDEGELLALELRIHETLQKSENTNFNIEEFQNRINNLREAELRNYEAEKTFSPDQGDLKIYYPNGSFIIIHQNELTTPSSELTLSELKSILQTKRAEQLQSSSFDRLVKKSSETQTESWRFAVDKSLIEPSKYFDLRVKELKLINNQNLFLFEGLEAVKQLAEKVNGRFAVEQWCFEIRRENTKSVDALAELIKPFEEKCSRWFFHPAPLKPEQIEGWKEYLDFEEHNNSQLGEVRIEYLYKRCLEVCANYVEFWTRRANYLLNLKRKKESKDTYLTAISQICKWRPEIYLEYSEFLENHEEFQEVEKIFEKLLTDDSFSHSRKMVEVWLRAISFYRRRENYSRCINLYESSIQNVLEDQKKVLLIMDYAHFQIIHQHSPQDAIANLSDNYDRFQNNLAFCKYYIDVLENHMSDKEEKFEKISNIYEKLINNVEISIPVKWEIYRAYLSFKKNSSSRIADYLELKKEAQKFLHDHRNRLLQNSLKPDTKYLSTVYPINSESARDTGNPIFDPYINGNYVCCYQDSYFYPQSNTHISNC